MVLKKGKFFRVNKKFIESKTFSQKGADFEGDRIPIKKLVSDRYEIITKEYIEGGCRK
ncbi:MAG: hypothetical protein PHW96_03875 [Candidatus Nanoarchaeia archaeon]|nr:hypothetical protein [Candidatus Nanoarchaeia archaeon]